MRYPFAEIESKWQQYWEDNKINCTDLSKTEKQLYSLVMFIYPSGAKLHCGHWYNYAPADSWSRFKRLQGYNVFEPMGYDAFGLPAENYAIKTGIHPKDSTMTNIADIRRQLKSIGCMYDWDKELMTCVPEYYKWNQWLFLQLFERGLAYRKNAPVNWCDSCQTVLANEQVASDGTCERCSNLVIQKNLTQWFFKITDYADELLAGLDTIKWPEKTKTMQRNWIGRSYGAEVVFDIEDSDEKIKVFTTRPDTLYGVTYVVLAPEHTLVDRVAKPEFAAAIAGYREEAKKLTEIERTSTVKEKTGVPTGTYAVNPVNGERIPIWVSDYVLLTYGTGCVMAVPAHDERDFEFAKKFNLEIRKVILESGTNESDELQAAFTGAGTMVNSAEHNGMLSLDFKLAIVEKLQAISAGQKKVNYRLRDWLISRQRYWGTPIPIIHCQKCGEVPVPYSQLPLELPYDVEFKPTGESPLASNEKFINTGCPKCGAPAKRDADTMDTFVDSSWYYFRFLNPRFEDGMFDTKLAEAWTPVGMYIGGAEHATMHLLYARFIHKFLRDIGMAKSDEPFRTLVHQGTITNAGAKMSKSRGNVVNPDEFIVKHGSDVFRMYLMFMGPFEMGGDWSDKGIAGTDRFILRMYEFIKNYENITKTAIVPDSFVITALADEEKAVYREVHQTLHKVTIELENLRFNTAIAAMMELSGKLGKRFVQCRVELQAYVLQIFISMMAPLAPHFAEECWQIIGKEKSIFAEPVWYTVDAAALIEDEVMIAVQVNGKLRGTIPMPLDSTQDEVKAALQNVESVTRHTSGKTVVKEIYVKNKIYNIVVK